MSPCDPTERVLHIVILLHPLGGGSTGQVAGEEEENHVEIIPEPLVHPVVDDGVDTGGGHGQPVEGQVDVVDVGYPRQRVTDYFLVINFSTIMLSGCQMSEPRWN